jgi:glycosyltransferase involved in cell wall biosynthesis
MKIGIYLQISARPLVPGGAERCAATLATALAERHDVDFVHHPPAIDLAHFGAFCGLDLSRLKSRCVESEDFPEVRTSNPWVRYRKARAWNAALSAPYDLFVVITPFVPPFCHARRGALRITFPLVDRESLWPWRGTADGGRRTWRNRLSRLYAAWEWRRRFAGYQAVAANSRFTQRWVRRRWAIDCSAVYPPVELEVPDREKRNLILSVGRFSISTPCKNQLEMVLAFRELSAKSGLIGWSYATAGGLKDDPDEVAYFERVRRAAAGGGVLLLPNLERERLLDLYGESKIFWHAAGLGEDEEARPESTEHFGIVTVEAMAAGCVPIVIRKGGQPEIVEHGVSGFLWDTLEELKEYTELLAGDDKLRARMASAARARAMRFSRAAYVDAMLALLEPLLA